MNTHIRLLLLACTNSLDSIGFGASPGGTTAINICSPFYARPNLYTTLITRPDPLDEERDRLRDYGTPVSEL